jgi:hypothetical protein
MSAPVHLAVYTFAILGLLTAIGIGPALLLGNRIPSSALMAPALGFAITAAVLVSLSYEITMSAGAWLVVFPLACCSVIVAVAVARRRHVDMREIAIPIGIGVLGLTFSCTPGFLLGTTGPTTLMVLDAWGYIPADLWLQHHTAVASLPQEALRYDLISTDGHYWMGGDNRIGSMVVGASLASLLGTSPDQTHLALLAVLYAIGPSSIWVLARSAGVGRLAASFGAAFGLSPALLMLVFDSTEANLIGLAIAPLALLLVARAVIGGSLREAVLAAVLIAGLVASYPEYLLPFALVAILAIVAVAICESLSRQAGPRQLGAIGLRTLGIAAAALAITPVATHRMLGFLPSVRNIATIGDLPPRWLTVNDFGAWLFGILNLYQLPRFDVLSPTKTAIAIVLPVILTAFIVFGLARRIETELAVIAAGLIVPLPLGLYVYGQFQHGHCQYCMWKSFTFMLPFLGAGVALGTDRVLAVTSRLSGGKLRMVVLIPLGGIALLSLASMGNANIHVIEATYESTTYFPTSLRLLAADARRLMPHSANMLIEGSDSAHNPPYATSTMYYAAHDMNNPRLSFDVDPFGTYELGAPLGFAAYYSPRYEYVLTAFGGVKNGRKVLARRSNFALERRAPVDVAITHAGWALDPREGYAAIPWIAGPFTLRISSTRDARTAITVTIRRPLRDHPTLQFLDADGHPQRTSYSSDSSSFCTVATVAAGLATVRVQPSFDQPPPVVGRATETDPLPAPPKAVGVASVRGKIGNCPASYRQQASAIVYGSGWFAPEPEPPDRYRWMGTTAKVAVGDAGEQRKALTLKSTVYSLAVPRHLTVTLDGRIIARITAPARSQAPFSIHIPAGKGTAELEFRAAPRAAAASQVTPGDTRVLAVRLREFTTSS